MENRGKIRSKNELPSSDSFPQSLQWLELVRPEAGSLELNPGLQHGGGGEGVCSEQPESHVTPGT